MDDVEELHDGGAVVGDGDGALVVVDQLVHAAGAEGGADDVSHHRAGVDVAHQLPLPLRRVRAFLQQDDLRLQHGCHCRGSELAEEKREREKEREGGRRREKGD